MSGSPDLPVGYSRNPDRATGPGQRCCWALEDMGDMESGGCVRHLFLTPEAVMLQYVVCDMITSYHTYDHSFQFI